MNMPIFLLLLHSFPLLISCPFCDASESLYVKRIWKELGLDFTSCNISNILNSQSSLLVALTKKFQTISIHSNHLPKIYNLQCQTSVSKNISSNKGPVKQERHNRIMICSEFEQNQAVQNSGTEIEKCVQNYQQNFKRMCQGQS